MNERPDINPMLEMLKSRRSVPVLAMQGPGPDASQIDMLLTIASRVPDHGKICPWRFIVFEGEARERAGSVIADRFRAKTPDATDAQTEIERKRLLHAPVVIAVVAKPVDHPKIPEWEQLMSAGASCMNIVAAANAMGFVTSWLTQWYAYDPEVLRQFGVAEGERIAGFIHIGRKETPVEDRPRPALQDIVSRY
ncbi:MAG: nitroreductase [Hyphomicrobiales bacterium]|nr:nitroreductase [Hyphomicrobiales bacterium]